MKKSSYPLPHFSVNRPVTVTMILLAMLVVGAIAYSRIPLALFPAGMQWPRLYAQAFYPNAGAIEVEKKVVRLMEEAVAQIGGVKSMRSMAPLDDFERSSSVKFVNSRSMQAV